LFQGAPRVQQSHPTIVDDFAPLIPWVLFCAGLEGKWGVDQIKVNIVDAKRQETCFEGRLNSLRTVVVVPELRADKDFLALHASSPEHLLKRLSDGLFVAIALRAVELPKANLQSRLGCAYRVM
jgi:hypothetical protein